MRIACGLLVCALLCALDFSDGLNIMDLFGGMRNTEGCVDKYCMVCQPGWIKSYQPMNPCVRTCPDGFHKAKYPGSQQYSCRRCRENCKVCNDHLNCDVCNNGYALMATAFRRCVAKCPANYVTMNTRRGQVCKNDASGCADESCTKCNKGYYLLRDWKASQCVEHCPAGYFSSQEGDVLKCEKCLYNCARCSTHLTCDRCYPGFSLMVAKSRSYCLRPRNE